MKGAKAQVASGADSRAYRNQNTPRATATRRSPVWLCHCLVVALPFLLGQSAPAARHFAIHVIDEQTGRGVPLVELKTTHEVRYFTDSNGFVAFDEPGLMGQDVYFHVRGHGYEYPKDGFGYAGVRLHVTEGGSAQIKLKRLNVAERLYRITGAGIYRDSVLLGRPVPIEQPVLNGQVFGSDSVLTALYHGRLFWLWGDTNRPSYPLGNFHATGATSRLPGDGGLDPDIGVNLTYFVGDTGFAKRMAPRQEEGCVWLDALVTLPDDLGRERLLAAFARVRGLEATLERGFVEYDDEKQEFTHILSFPLDTPVWPAGHPVRAAVRAPAGAGEATEFLYFATAFPLTRVPSDRAHYLDVSACEAYTCLQDGTRPADGRIDRDGRGRVRYAWRRDTPALSMKDQADLVKAGHLEPGECLLQVQDVETGKTVLMHGGSVYWNAFRRRWIMIATEAFGTTMLGELWYVEADTPLGPWVYARKIVTHENYSFYNPKQHPEFAKDGGRTIYFEGTYTTLFSGNPAPTPRYDYNQIMYRLDLGDPRLVLPVPVYDLGGGEQLGRWATRAQVPAQASARPIAFFACDRPGPGTVPVRAVLTGAGHFRLVPGAATSAPTEDSAAPIFHALPASTEPRPTQAALHEFVHGDGRRAYSTDSAWSQPGFQRTDQPLCYVWRNPFSPAITFDPTLESSPGPR